MTTLLTLAALVLAGSLPRLVPKLLRTSPTADTTVVTTAETVIATLGGITTTRSDGRVVLSGWAEFTAGAGTTAYTLRVRRTSVTGTLVGEGNAAAIAASAAGEGNVEVTDTPGEIAGGVYVLTIQQTGATGNATVAQATLQALVD